MHNLQNISENVMPSTTKGPLVCGMRSFENRYVGLLNLSMVAHPLKKYVKRWTILENQPADVVKVTNLTTRRIEIRSPRLPWPTQFLIGSSALEFNQFSDAIVANFETAILQITVVSVCGLRSVQLSKLFHKCRGPQFANDQMHCGMVVAEMIANYQSVIQNSGKLSTYVHVHFGREQFITKVNFSIIMNQA